MRRKHKLTIVSSLLIAGVILAACQANVPQPVPSPSELSPAPVSDTPESATPEKIPVSVDPYLALTYQNPDGNRYVEGIANLPGTTPLDIPLSEPPVWVLGAPLEEGTVWVVVLESGAVEAFEVVSGKVTQISITPSQLDPGQPPSLLITEGRLELLVPQNANASTLTHPIPIPGGIAEIADNGDVGFSSDGEFTWLPANALVDGRLLFNDEGQVLVYSHPSDEYGHGILGDPLEPTRITIFDSAPTPAINQVIEIPAGQVIEGLLPIWTDIDQDGTAEIIITQSDSSQGAQIVVYEQDGSVRAIGSAIGLGGRWRHQIAVAPFGPNGEIELVDVLTPHIGGIVEFFRISGEKLVRVSRLEGYTSHVIRTRNLDMAAAADFDGDGIVELLLPSNDYTRLGAVQRTLDGAEVDWELELNGKLTTNLAVARLGDGSLAVGVGLAENILRLWLP